MEKNERNLFKTAIICEISQGTSQIIFFLHKVLPLTLKETRLYIINSCKSHEIDYFSVERLLTTLYNQAFLAKKNDFLFEFSVYLPFLFGQNIETLLEKQDFDAVFIGENLKLSHPKTERLSSSPLEEAVYKEIDTKSPEDASKYVLFSLKTLAIGGTFDYLHTGHKLFLSCTAILAANESTLTIGLTGDALLKNKQGSELLQAFCVRQAKLEAFLKDFHPNLALNIVELNEPCGPTKTEYFEALIVTEETMKGAEFINEERKKIGLEKLQVYVTGLVNRGSGISEKLSSGEIRKELIRRMGNLEGEALKKCLETVRRPWREIFGTFGFHKDFFEQWLDRMIRCYCEQWRVYHSLLHIETMMNLFLEYQGEISNRRRVVLAVWFHDAVYVPGSKTNEQDSVDLMRVFEREMLGMVFDDKEKESLRKDFDLVGEYILATRDHFQNHGELEKDKDMAFFLDFDISILGADLEIYNRYSEGIYKEYASVPDLFKKRAFFLECILKEEGKSFFRTEVLRGKFEKQARKNMQAELLSLNKL